MCQKCTLLPSITLDFVSFELDRLFFRKTLFDLTLAAESGFFVVQLALSKNISLVLLEE